MSFFVSYTDRQFKEIFRSKKTKDYQDGYTVQQGASVVVFIGKGFFFQGEEEADGEEDNEDDDGFFVPHGYLSDDEGVLDEEMEDDGESDKKVRYDRFNEYLF